MDPASEDGAVVIMVSCRSRDEAERLGEELVVRRLAACGSVIPTVHSFYFWKGELVREHEALLLVKTAAGRAEAAQEHIRANHAGELPEILQLPVTGGSPDYLRWLMESVAADRA